MSLTNPLATRRCDDRTSHRGYRLKDRNCAASENGESDSAREYEPGPPFGSLCYPSCDIDEGVHNLKAGSEKNHKRYYFREHASGLDVCIDERTGKQHQFGGSGNVTGQCRNRRIDPVLSGSSFALWTRVAHSAFSTGLCFPSSLLRRRAT